MLRTTEFGDGLPERLQHYRRQDLTGQAARQIVRSGAGWPKCVIVECAGLLGARYREPEYLMLDEGTANLDRENDRRIADLIAALKCTRVVVTHSAEVSARADRVFALSTASGVTGLTLIDRTAHAAATD